MNTFLVLAALLFSNAQTITIDTNNQKVPQSILAVAAQGISDKCTEISNTNLELISVEFQNVELDQGKVDKYYSLVLEVPNGTNDDDEDTIEITVVDAAIDNPTVANPTVSSLAGYGWISCK